jgi:hypothetical protein
MFTRIVSGDGMPMHKRSGSLHFALKPRDRLLGAIGRSGQEFDRDDAFHPAMFCSKDLPHSTATDAFQQYIVADSLVRAL